MIDCRYGIERPSPNLDAAERTGTAGAMLVGIQYDIGVS